jgi:hypothetical protein
MKTYGGVDIDSCVSDQPPYLWRKSPSYLFDRREASAIFNK